MSDIQANLLLPIPGIIREKFNRFIETSPINELYANRIILLVGEVSDALAISVTCQLLGLEQESPKAPIQLYVMSPGGSVPAGLTIYDTMRSVRNPIITYAIGDCCSMGAFLFSGGDLRIIRRHARIMVHQVSSYGLGGHVHEMEIAIREVNRMNEVLFSHFARFTHGKITLENKDEVAPRDKWFSAEEAIQWKLADRIAEDVSKHPLPSGLFNSKDQK